jgi:hypothetical protein
MINIIRMLKSKNMRGGEYVAQIGEKINKHKVSVTKHEYRDHLVGLVVNGRIILKLILNKRNWEIVDWIHVA